jgi:hypothetical protein
VGPILGGTHTFWFVGSTILFSGMSSFNKPKPSGIFAPSIAPCLQQNLGRRIARGPRWFISIQEARGSGLSIFKKKSRTLSKLICSATHTEDNLGKPLELYRNSFPKTPLR